MNKPIRIQRSRQHKMVSPNGLPIVYVGRPSKWGNPYNEQSFPTLSKEEWVENYKRLMLIPQNIAIASLLKGKNLACWCPLDQPCHADILLEIANE